MSTEKTLLSINPSTSQQGHHLYRDDMNGLVTTYGPRLKQAAGYYQADPFAAVIPPVWTGIVGPPPSADDARTRITICNSMPGQNMYGSAVYAYVFPQLKIFDITEGGWSLVTSINEWSAYHTGTACKSPVPETNIDDAMVAILGDYDNTTGLQNVKSITTTNGFSTYTTSVEATGADRTTNAGINATFDAYSGKYVMAWRNNNDEIVTKVLTPGAPLKRYGVSQGHYLRASDSPGIACSYVTTPDQNRCVLSWPSTSWLRTADSAFGYVNTATNTFEILMPTQTTSEPSYGTPYVAWITQIDDLGFPMTQWTMAFHNYEAAPNEEARVRIYDYDPAFLQFIHVGDLDVTTNGLDDGQIGAPTLGSLLPRLLTIDPLPPRIYVLTSGWEPPPPP